jgi:hypothetical protein
LRLCFSRQMTSGKIQSSIQFSKGVAETPQKRAITQIPPRPHVHSLR